MIVVSRVHSDNLTDLTALLGAIARQESPDDPRVADRAGAGLAVSRAIFDWARSDSFWILLAHLDGEPAGYAAVCRIPKIDERAGFLFVDELHVLRTFRGRGVARALLMRIDELTRHLGLQGVRLLVRPNNEQARRVYRQAGFEENETIFCQKKLT